MQHVPDAAVEALKITPPAAVSLYTLAGMSLEQWVTTLTILYLLILIAEKLAKWVSKCRR